MSSAKPWLAHTVSIRNWGNELEPQANLHPDLYNAFLAPGSPCELNIDHTLRFALIKRMTKPDLPEDGLRTAVDETAHLYKEAKASIFKLMASVSLAMPHSGRGTG